MIDHALAFLFAIAFEPLAYTAGLVWCMGMAVVVLRFADRAFRKSEGKEV